MREIYIFSFEKLREIYLNRECANFLEKNFSNSFFFFLILLNYNFNPIFYFLRIKII